jgi:hypothetical protein
MAIADRNCPLKLERSLQWFHVRVVVARPKLSVFVNGATQPSLVVNELGDLVA